MELANPRKEYVEQDHLTYDCSYHVVFCPKYRRKILVGKLRDFVGEIFDKIAETNDFAIESCDIEPDSIHVVISCSPKRTIFECINALKRQSTPLMRSFDPSLNSRMPTIWTRSAFISTAGSVDTADIKAYINLQKGK